VRLARAIAPGVRTGREGCLPRNKGGAALWYQRAKSPEARRRGQHMAVRASCRPRPAFGTALGSAAIGTWVLFLCCASGQGPSSLRTCTIRDSADSVILRYTFYIGPGRDTVRHGRYERWHSNGRKAQEGYYTEGRKDSVWLEWDSCAFLVLEEHWMRGVRHGFYRRTGPPGEKGGTGNYVDGVKQGCWSEHGLEGCYIDGRRSGVWLELAGADRGGNNFYWAGVFVDNKKEGRWIHTASRSKRGRPTIRQRCYEAVFREGMLVRQSPCSDATWDSLLRAYDEARQRGQAEYCKECQDTVARFLSNK
jgi:hypothetical protein